MAEYNKYAEDIFDIISWLKKVEEDPTIPLETWLNRDSTVDYKRKQLAYSEKQKITSYFENVIDQPSYSTKDHLRVRRMLIDWYTGLKTPMTECNSGSDPFNLSGEALNELIRSFGFPYPHMIISNNLKAQFILNIVELYKNKGTPAALITALETYFGFNDIVLSEWWIRKTADGSFVARSKPVFPRVLRKKSDMIAEIPYSTFIANDPLWSMSESELSRLYNESQITLPSLTSLLTLQGTIDIGIGLTTSLAILNRKLQESYEFWLANGQMNRNIHPAQFNASVSLLELVLAICYCMQMYGKVKGDRYTFYNGLYTPLDQPDENGDRDDIDDVDYGLIIDEYNNLSVRPTTKEERDTNLETRNSKFTSLISDQSVTDLFIRDSTAYVPGYNVTEGYGFDSTTSEVGAMLLRMNPDFKYELDTYINNGGNIQKLINYLLMDLEFHMIYTMEIMKYPISSLILGSPLAQHLAPVIDFFKPLRARIRDFISILSINDPLADSQLEADEQGTTTINQVIVEEGNWADELFDHGLVMDIAEISIEQVLSDELPYRDSTSDDGSYLNSIGAIDLISDPNGISDCFEIVIYKDGIETSYNSLPEVIIWSLP